MSKVCFVLLALTLLAGEKIIIGGFAPKTLKKLKGDKFGTPFSLIVLAKAIGLGATAPRRYPCNFEVGMLLGSIDNIVFIFLV